MRKSCLLAGFLAATASLCALAAAPATPGHAGPYLRGQQCLDPPSARGFSSFDERRLLVDAGRNRYLIEVSQACWNIDFASAIGFRGDPISGKVCGGPMDAILLRGEPPCHIESMLLLDKAQYQAALREREEWRRARRAEREAAKKQH